MRAVNKLAAGIAAVSIVLAGVPAAHAEETPPATATPVAEAVDTTAPTLVSFTGAPASVAPGEVFSFTATAADPGGIVGLGFNPSTALTYPKFQSAPYTSGDIIDNGDGTWTRSFTYAAHRDTPYGTYDLGRILMVDTAGNRAFSTWTTSPKITVADPDHPVGELALTRPQLTFGTVSATIDAPGARVHYSWWGRSASGAYTSSSQQTYEVPLFMAGATITARATAVWPDGTVRERTTTFIPAKGSMPLEPVTLAGARVGAPAAAGYTPVAAILGRYLATTYAQSFQWLVEGTPVPGATQPTYAPVGSDRGKKVQLRVTTTTTLPFAEQTVIQHSPTRTIGTGALSATTPKISGSRYVGFKLTANPGTWTKSTTLSYQWYRSGKAIKGATRSTYTSVTADHAKSITVKVTGRKSGYTTRTVVSAPVKATLRKQTPPEIEPYGSWEPGNPFTARNFHIQKWLPGTKVTYQWYRDGKPIRGATGRAYVIKRSDIGHRIHVRHTGTKFGYLPASTSIWPIRI